MKIALTQEKREMYGGRVGIFKGIIIPDDFHILYYDFLMSFNIDALLEELERSTLQDSHEYSSPAPLPLDQHSRKESNLEEASKILSVQDDTSPLRVTFHLLEYLEYRCSSAFLKINCISHKMM